VRWYRFQPDSVSQDGLHGSARRADSGKEFSVHLVESAEVLNVGEMAGALHYIIKAVASAMQDLPDVVERQSGLISPLRPNMNP